MTQSLIQQRKKELKQEIQRAEQHLQRNFAHLDLKEYLPDFSNWAPEMIQSLVSQRNQHRAKRNESSFLDESHNGQAHPSNDHLRTIVKAIKILRS